jgi:hypothetical protein
MDVRNEGANAAEFDLERELEAWDWVRPAGISAEELRRAILAAAPSPQPKLRKAA